MFAVGQQPTGSSDPYALRRNAIGIINILLAGFPVSLAQLIEEALEHLDDVQYDHLAVQAALREFFAGRLEVIARERGLDADVVTAVLSTGSIEPADVLARVEAIKAFRDSNPELFEDLATAYVRANNLRIANMGSIIDKELLSDSELALLKAVDKVADGIAQALADQRYDRAVQYLASLRAPIDRFFEEVLVMDPDERLRANRLRLLNRFVSVFSQVADIGKLAKPG
jgi:glycyl-tRNA synthetase beta chain